MSSAKQPPRGGAASGELLPRPLHGHGSAEPDPACVEPRAKRNGETTDPHPSWLKMWRQRRAELVDDRSARSAQDPIRELQDKIARTPAETLAGLQAQAELISELAWNDVVAATARQLIAGLKRMRRRGAR